MNLTSLLRGRGDRIATWEDERDVIQRAQAGDDAAVERLVRAYRDLLNAAVIKHRDQLGDDDALMIALEGFLEAIKLWDPAYGHRLSIIAKVRILRAFSIALGDHHGVQERILRAVFGYLVEADGDPQLAEDAAAAEPDMNRRLSRATFRDALAIVRRASIESEASKRAEATDSDYDPGTLAAQSLWVADVDDFAAAEQRVLCEVAFAAVDDFSRSVCRRAYGFDSYDVPTLPEVAAELGVSRAKVVRTREAALAQMRVALGVDA